MKENKIYNIEYLLPRYCDGKVTEEEQQVVEAWIASSDENLRVAKQIHTLYLASDTLTVMTKINTEQALKAVNSRIVVEGAVKKNRLAWWLFVQRIAAILLIPLLMGYGMLYLQEEEPVPIYLTEVKTNPGMTTRLTLPDGTLVHLNSESTLQYPTTFQKGVRRVTLNGEAYFEVTASKEHPFLISTPFNSEIEVTGTHFNVEAYAEESTLSTTLLEGEVSFLYKKGQQHKKVSLQPGHRLVYNSLSSDVKLYETSGLSELAWTKGGIVFKNTPFKEALRMLEKRYHVDFVVSTTHFEGDTFSGTFSSQRLERILEYFKLSSKIRWRYMDADYESEERTKIEIY